jgi:hypothetical protein
MIWKKTAAVLQIAVSQNFVGAIEVISENLSENRQRLCLLLVRKVCNASYKRRCFVSLLGT